MTDLSDLERTKHGSIVGRIWFAAGDDAFPGPRWSDFVVVVLGWWIDALLDLRKLVRNHAEFLFMDGPYSVFLQPSEGGLLMLSFRRDQTPVPGMTPPIFAPRYDLGANLVTVAREVVAACRRQGWSGDVEVKNLARLADELASDLPLGERDA